MTRDDELIIISESVRGNSSLSMEIRNLARRRVEIVSIPENAKESSLGTAIITAQAENGFKFEIPVCYLKTKREGLVRLGAQLRI